LFASALTLELLKLFCLFFHIHHYCGHFDVLRIFKDTRELWPLYYLVLKLLELIREQGLAQWIRIDLNLHPQSFILDLNDLVATISIIEEPEKLY
jgi:hypothetical protein